MGKGKLPEEQPQQAKPTLKPPTLITPEEVVQHLFPTFFFLKIFICSILTHILISDRNFHLSKLFIHVN